MMGQNIAGINDFAYFYRKESHGPGGGGGVETKIEKCPPAGTGMKIKFPSSRAYQNYYGESSQYGQNIRSRGSKSLQRVLRPVFFSQRLAAEKAHGKNRISEHLLDGRLSLGHPAGVPKKMPFSLSFLNCAGNFLGLQPVDPMFVPPGVDTQPVSQGFFLSLRTFFFP